MLKRCLLAVVICLTVFFASPAPGQTQGALQKGVPQTPAAAQPPMEYKPTPEEAELIRLSREWMDAAIRKDYTKLDQLMALNFTLQLWDASRAPQSRDKWLGTLRTRLGEWKIDYTAISARVFGDFGVVYSRFRWSGKLDGKPFKDAGFLADVWIRKGGKWKVMARRSAPQQQIQTLLKEAQVEVRGGSAERR